MAVIKVGTFTSTGAAYNLALGFVPSRIRMWNDTAIATPTNTEVAMAEWVSGMANGSAYVWTYNATPIQVLTKITSNGFTPYSVADGSLYPATNRTITGITQAAQAVVTSASHGFTSDDVGVTVVTFHGVVGMTQINTLSGVIQSVPDANTFSVNINTTGFTAYSSGGIANIITGSPALQGGTISSGNAPGFPPAQTNTSQILNTALYNAGALGITFGTGVVGGNNDVIFYEAVLDAPFTS